MTPEDQTFFRDYCARQGFDLAAFDTWLTSMVGHGVHLELTERRRLAYAGARADNVDRALRHLEWMLLRWHWIRRVDKLSPLAKLGDARSKGLSAFAVMGNQARTKYSEADKERWRHLLKTNPDLARLYQSSKRACAQKIAQLEGLDTGAAETIRKAI